jgi:hypothetical protein
MIRREAYDRAGPYDPRLTNLQDFDMWVRMLITGNTIHVLSERLTAFRIRDDAANMSAPRPDSIMRGAFETTRVLRHFADLDATLLHDLFGGNLIETCRPDAPVSLRLALLAARHPRISHKNFALQLFYESACEAADFCQLQQLSGTVDALGVQAIELVNQRVNLLNQQVNLLNQQIADAASVTAELRGSEARLQNEVARAQEQRAQMQQQRAAIERSMSWRITRPMRMITGHLPRSWRRVLRPT